MHGCVAKIAEKAPEIPVHPRLQPASPYGKWVRDIVSFPARRRSPFTLRRRRGRTPSVTCTFDDHGLATLSCGGNQFIKSGTPNISNVFFADDKGGEVAADKSSPNITFDRVTQSYSYALPWGAVRCRYQLAEGRLNIELTVENDTAGPMNGVALDLLALQFPHRPAGTPWEKRFEMISDNEDDITAMVADYQTGVLTFCNDDPTSSIRSGFAPAAAPPQETWQLRVTSQEPTGLPARKSSSNRAARRRSTFPSASPQPARRSR